MTGTCKWSKKYFYISIICTNLLKLIENPSYNKNLSYKENLYYNKKLSYNDRFAHNENTSNNES